MQNLVYFSNLILPLFIFYVLGTGLLEKRDVYRDFLDGAEEGLKTVIHIFPTLMGLMLSTGVLRASGFLEFIGNAIGRISDKLGFPGELVPLSLIRLFSSSAAVGLLLDLFKKYGADSKIGWMAALILGSTESVFYCMSVYLGSVQIRKSRYTLAGALLATMSGVLAAVWIVQNWGVHI